MGDSCEVAARLGILHTHFSQDGRTMRLEADIDDDGVSAMLLNNRVFWKCWGTTTVMGTTPVSTGKWYYEVVTVPVTSSLGPD